MNSYDVLTQKKGVSPVIATVLLIAMVMIIGLIIFLWFKNMVGEELTKFDKNVKLVCDDVRFTASYDTQLRVSNTGNVPIFGMKAKIFTEGSHDTDNVAGWPGLGLKQGGVFSGSDSRIEGADKVILIPVLLGATDSGQEKSFTCDDKNGLEITL